MSDAEAYADNYADSEMYRYPVIDDEDDSIAVHAPDMWSAIQRAYVAGFERALAVARERI